MSDPGDSAPVASSAEPSVDAEPPERLVLAIVEEAGNWNGFADVEQAIGTAAAALASHPSCHAARGMEANVVLADDALLRRLNATYRGKDVPTNVLSFPFQAGAAGVGPRHLGDVVLAAETIAREASEQQLAPQHHLQHLIVHGLLHLLGFEHDTEAEAEVMEGLEIDILSTLGIANPYAPIDA